jgi:hypothetical protein
MPESRKYKMTIGLNVLNHLGEGLYSNIPAVISEMVANAWDADANEVTIDINPVEGTISIEDDGTGMNLEDINCKYLTVGYQKRNDATLTSSKRHVMGRKGIGKLSIFSIAKNADIHTIKNGKKNGFRMSIKAIKEQIEEGYDYYPAAIPENEIKIFNKKGNGTRLVLYGLKKEISSRTSSHLRKRLARRFSIIGDEHKFSVIIDKTPITPQDRDFFDKIEFLWYFGDESEHYRDRAKNARQISRLDNKFEVEVVDEDGKKSIQEYSIKGWIATVDEQKNIDELNNTIVLFAHGKLVHEDILEDLKEAGFYAAYLIGEIDADFLDLDDKEDIVTSARQSVKEDDPRYIALKEFIRKSLKKIQGEWSELRKKEAKERALINEHIKKWYQTL